MIGRFTVDYSDAIKQGEIYNQHLKKLDAVLKQIASNAGVQIQSQAAQLGTATDKIAASVKKVDTAMGGTGKAETFWERRFGWFVAGSAFYGTLKAARDIADNMEKIETAMVTIKRISNEPLADFTQMQKDLLDLGIQYGRTWNTVSDVATKWAQAGYSVNDTVQLTRTSLLALNTAEMNATQATQGMIAIMAQWGLTAESLLPVLDKINKTADSYAVSSQDLIDGLVRSSGAARMLNMTLEETLGVITALREGSGRTGREVGNALNSILAFMQRAKSLDIMKDFGVDVGSGSEMRSIMDIFTDIASRWPTLSQEVQDSFVNAADSAGLYAEEIANVVTETETFTQAQQRELAAANSGLYRRNYFMALMANFGKVLDVVTNMENALGYSERENAKHMETYAAKVNQLKAAWEAFSDVFAQTGLLEQMKGVTDGMRGILNFFNALPPPMKAATGAMIEYAAAVAMARLAQRTFGLESLGTMLKGVTASQIGFLAPTTGALGKTGTWLAGLSTWQVAGGMAALAGIISLIKQYVKASEELRDVSKRYYETQKAIEDTTEGTKEHDIALQNHADLIELIAERYPELVTRIDEHGRAVEIETSAIERRNRAMGDALSPLDQMKEKYSELTTELNLLIEEYNRLSGQPTVIDRSQIADEGVSPAGLPVPTGTQRADVFSRITGVRKQLDEVGAEIGRLGGTTPGGTEVKAFHDLDAAKERYDRYTQSVLSMDLALIEVRKSLRLVESEEKSLGETMEDANRKKVLAAQRARLLAEENDLLGASNSDLNARLTVLNELMGQADEAISSLAEGTEKDNWLSFQKSITSEIRSTTQELADNTVEMRDNQLAIQNSSREVQEFYDRIREAQRTLKDESFQMIRDSIDHQVRMGAMNRDHQISYLRQMLIAYADDAERRREIEEDLQDLYKEGIEEQLDIAEEAYRKRRQMIEDEADAEIASIQRRIDALNDKSELASREEAERQHKNKLQELEKEWQYHDLRLGKDHEKSKLDITQQIEEEKIRWKNQVDEWSRDDRRKRLEEEIDDIREAARKAQDELDDAWKRTQTMFDQNVATMIASASVFNDSWYSTGLSWGERLAEGLMAGTDGIDQVLSDISGEARSAGSDSGKMARSLELLEAKREWERANELGDVEGMERAAEWGKRIRSSGATIDPSNTLSSDELAKLIKSQLPQAHTGAYVAESGIANLLKGEIVLNPRLSTQFARLADALERNPSMSTSTNFNIKSLVNLENADLSDKQDLDALASILFGRMVSLMNSKGSTLGVSA